MPLQQRIIEPVNVSRSTLPLPPGDIKPLIKSIAAATGQGLAANAAAAANINIVNELECVTNGTLANLIRQLSSLSRQAEELLTGVFDDASKLLTRTVNLQRRMEALSIKVEALDQPSDAPITLRDPANQHETFSSDMSCDQQVLSKQKMPSSITELYQTCDKPPPLYKLDPYREDGKNGLKFYTDPTYFFELWKKDMMKETIKAQQLQQTQPQQQQHQQQLHHHHQQQQQQQLQQQQQQKQNQSARTVQHQKRLSQHSPQQQYAGKARQQVVSINGSYTSSTTYVSSVDSSQDTYGQNSHPLNQVHKGSSDVEKSTEAMTRHMQQTTINENQMPIYQHQQQLQPAQHQAIQPPHQQQHQQQQPQQQQQQHYELLQKQQAHHSHQPQAELPNQGMQHYLPASYISSSQQAPNSHHMIATPPPPPPALSPLPPPTSPPPPPPPPAPPVPPAQTVAQPPQILQPPTAAELQQKQQQLRKTVPIQRDPRSDLLAAIKQGITLRRVEDSKRRVEAEKQQSMGNDVASILARRVAMQVSDSDENGDDDDDEDNDWDSQR